jgi:hypothetical protein
MLIGLVGYFYRKADNAEKSVMKATADHIKESVDELSRTIRENTEENKQLFAQNEHRFALVEQRVTKIETLCNLKNVDRWNQASRN